ncbi:hypothetical protein GXM_08860 [Nostoc sphaeroides CCNUC1]|uniref:Uncharacterized protein n=1 Tax=Nostoc sphaeroides CCNUC1 TaxID=2653204 RepID=A0A5P8WGS6_9NOSO|nr:hypothetical protein GXM_08860 [Nostoc sphaeroides CCNUC1]
MVYSLCPAQLQRLLVGAKFRSVAVVVGVNAVLGGYNLG